MPRDTTTPHADRGSMLDAIRDSIIAANVGQGSIVRPPIAPSAWGTPRGNSAGSEGTVARSGGRRPTVASAPADRREYVPRFDIGEVVKFDVEGDRKGDGIGATVRAITFTENKVLYDLALAVRGHPLMHRVSSDFVHEADEA